MTSFGTPVAPEKIISATSSGSGASGSGSTFDANGISSRRIVEIPNVSLTLKPATIAAARVFGTRRWMNARARHWIEGYDDDPG